MKTPSSIHFTPILLTNIFNLDRQHLAAPLRSPNDDDEATFGSQTFHGIPFELGLPNQPNVILLDDKAVSIEVADLRVTYLIFLHVVENRVSGYLEDLADFAGTIPGAGDSRGNELGGLVSDYSLMYADGTIITKPIQRRFAIQQTDISWGASPFAAVPAFETAVFSTTTEEQLLGRIPQQPYGRGETRTRSARDLAEHHRWLYALPNPHPEKLIQRIICSPKQERSLIYAISYTNVMTHPLRPGVRQKLKLKLPAGVQLNKLGELEEVDIDLGQVISARAVLDYDHERWLSSADRDVQPQQADNAVIIEYVAQPQAKLYLANPSNAPDAKDHLVVYDLAQLDQETVISLPPANRPVRLRVIEKETGQPVAVRLHLHGQMGEYLPPKGYHRKVNPYWFEDNYGEFVNGLNQYCYIPGDCVANLPLGQVFVEISRGYEVAPLRISFMVTPETDEITFELERVLHWRERGWVSADTHVHFLSPQTALREGSAEDVNVVNLLASQWGEMFSNVSDFDGKTTFGAKDFGGEGEFLVRVGTENRMQVLGHISLLGYSGRMIQPLCTGGSSESALGEPLEVTMAEWAEHCIQQGGLVVLPHTPNPQGERAADIVLGLVHAIEMMTFNPFVAQISPYGLADWYRYLNLGYHIPVVGGSDKMSAASLLGGVRTYTHLGDQAFTYENWMAAVKTGNTFVTVGPLVEITVEGISPGGCLELPSTGGTVNVSWQVESVSLPIDRVELVVGGLTAEQITVDKQLSTSGSMELKISQPSWIALRVRGSYHGKHGEIAAHTSTIQVTVAGKPLFSKNDAMAVLEQIEGAIAYVDTIAPRPEALRYKQLRVTLEAAYNRLHYRLHQNGIFHQHAPLHDHTYHHEH
jgi:hypothetical protein